MSLLSEIVGFRSAFNILCALDKAPVKGISWQALHAMASSDSGPDKAEEIIDQLLSSALIRCEGHYIRLTTFGVKTFLLLEALNGGDISSLFGRLSQLGEVAPTYELVRQGMTEKFLESLVTRPGFCRLYICSPWINLSRRARGFLVHAILQIEKRRRKAPELLVITRPDPQARTTAPATVKPFFHRSSSTSPVRDTACRLKYRHSKPLPTTSQIQVSARSPGRHNFLTSSVVRLNILPVLPSAFFISLSCIFPSPSVLPRNAVKLASLASLGH